LSIYIVFHKYIMQRTLSIQIILGWVCLHGDVFKIMNLNSYEAVGGSLCVQFPLASFVSKVFKGLLRGERGK
jgi:hypothetical protein